MHYGVPWPRAWRESHGIVYLAVLQDPNLVAAKVADEDAAVMLEGVMGVGSLLALRIGRSPIFVSVGKTDGLLGGEDTAAEVLRSAGYNSPTSPSPHMSQAQECSERS